MEELDIILETAKEQMQGTVSHLEVAFDKLRAGKATPAMLSSVRVDYYGSLSPLTQIANVNTPDAMTLSIQPYERNLIHEIEKAIINANLGFAPSNNGDTIIISIPPVTEERRKELVKMAKSDMETAKISLRNARQDANKALKAVKEASEDMVKDYETRVQGLTDKFSKKLEEALTKKEAEIMKV
ncbi:MULTISPECIES: ribosome recycling factor [Empedobacter]|uniref:Ribosome-recycling factor n=1 Tax=Empedobacter falsenii TaxID=343874 RepID=A0A376GDZ7_9FLAO|nr:MULTISPECIES: ribosome recycling factor [Empedobacter]HAR73501.1 ribosome recycling factor [Flavobacteriaceae bacterium]MBW1618327.1 ribosome recycling factor [Empedobacter falsenii]MBY0067131.1 ribosome recycling factor [Empedobacter falsenii]MDH0658733.1 ribosome recycling factor [Empedobacter sp. GD03865]MDH1880974.1 ribosome recycling factor [Empedobacter sp. GD03797]